MPFQCPTCESVCADEATACPKCGHPFRRGIQTTQRTGKKYKAMMAFGVMLCLASLVGCFAGSAMTDRTGTVTEQGEAITAMSGLGVIVGFLVASVARIGAWWHHE